MPTCSDTLTSVSRDRRHTDSTLPSGHTYITRPGSRLLFPALSLPTGELPTAPTAELPTGGRGVMMPTRRRTREQDRAYRIEAERALNSGASPKQPAAILTAGQRL